VITIDGDGGDAVLALGGDGGSGSASDLVGPSGTSPGGGGSAAEEVAAPRRMEREIAAGAPNDAVAESPLNRLEDRAGWTTKRWVYRFVDACQTC
jgi:hypothetical protein